METIPLWQRTNILGFLCLTLNTKYYAVRIKWLAGVSEALWICGLFCYHAMETISMFSFPGLLYIYKKYAIANATYPYRIYSVDITAYDGAPWIATPLGDTYVPLPDRYLFLMWWYRQLFQPKLLSYQSGISAIYSDLYLGTWSLIMAGLCCHNKFPTRRKGGRVYGLTISDWLDIITSPTNNYNASYLSLIWAVITC